MLRKARQSVRTRAVDMLPRPWAAAGHAGVVLTAAAAAAGVMRVLAARGLHDALLWCWSCTGLGLPLRWTTTAEVRQTAHAARRGMLVESRYIVLILAFAQDDHCTK